MAQVSAGIAMWRRSGGRQPRCCSAISAGRSGRSATPAPGRSPKGLVEDGEDARGLRPARVRGGARRQAGRAARPARPDPAEGRQMGRGVRARRRPRRRRDRQQQLHPRMAAEERPFPVLAGDRSRRLVRPGRGAGEDPAEPARHPRSARSAARLLAFTPFLPDWPRSGVPPVPRELPCCASMPASSTSTTSGW